VELFLKAPLTDEVARIHVQRAWYVALGSAAVMLLGSLFWTSLNLFLGGVIIVGLGHGMLYRSWVAAGALLLYLVAALLQAGWGQRQPLLILLAVAVAYFLTQGCRAVWWWHQGGGSPPNPPEVG
jgi:surface polysaccharide O-acyltransferase-like enzyme